MKLGIALVAVVMLAPGVALAGGKTCGAKAAKSSKASHNATFRTVAYGAEKDIVDTAVSAGTFNTLVAAVKAAGLVETLKGDGPFTVFAPTDEAFAALPRGTVESLLRPENRETLGAILKYHVVAGRIYADDAVGAEVATTLQGADLRIRIKDGRLMVNDATVVSSDVEATNGVIHVIDRVILPPK